MTPKTALDTHAAGLQPADGRARGNRAAPAGTPPAAARHGFLARLLAALFAADARYREGLSMEDLPDHLREDMGLPRRTAWPKLPPHAHLG